MQEDGKIALQRLKEINEDEKWVEAAQKPCLRFKMDVDGRTASKGQAIVNHSLKDIL